MTPLSLLNFKPMKLQVIDYDIASHNSLATVGFSAINALLAKTLNSLAQNIDSLSGSIATAFFFDELLHFAGNNQNVCHMLSSTGIRHQELLISK